MPFTTYDQYECVAALDRPLGEIESMAGEERVELFRALKGECQRVAEDRGQGITRTQRLIARFGDKLRSFPLEINGEQNIPRDGCLLMCNHSNSHDIIVTAEVLTSVGLPSSLMVATKGISFPVQILLRNARTTLIDRCDSRSRAFGLYDFAGKLANGDTCLIFGESTWNLHPFKPMQNLKIGGVKAAAIAGKPIVPVIYEYVEVSNECTKESELYSKCMVRFGEPITIDPRQSLIKQNDRLQTAMEDMRRGIWMDAGTYREGASDVNPQTYVNHTWMKKFGSPLFFFDSEFENKYLLAKQGETVENEWHIDGSGAFGPGIIPKKPRVGKL